MKGIYVNQQQLDGLFTVMEMADISIEALKEEALRLKEENRKLREEIEVATAPNDYHAIDNYNKGWNNGYRSALESVMANITDALGANAYDALELQMRRLEADRKFMQFQ